MAAEKAGWPPPLSPATVETLSALAEMCTKREVAIRAALKLLDVEDGEPAQRGVEAARLLREGLK